MHPDDEGLNETRRENCIQSHAAERVRVDEVTELVTVLAEYEVGTALYKALNDGKLDYTDKAMLQKLYALATQTHTAVMSYYNDNRDREL